MISMHVSLQTNVHILQLNIDSKYAIKMVKLSSLKMIERITYSNVS